MAEKVGDVYVTVHADNSRMHNEIRAQAAKDGRAYGNEFDKALADEFNRTAAKSRQRLAKAFATGDFSEFEKEAGGAAQAVEKVNREVEHLISTNQISLKQAREVKDAVAKWAVPRTMTKDVEKVALNLDKVHQEALHMNQAFDRAGYLISKTGKDAQAATREAIKMNKAFDKVGKAALEGGKAAKTGFRDIEKALKLTGPLTDKLASGIGSLFGKGSRNNFFNIVGSIMQGLVEMFTLPLKMAGPAASAIGLMSDGLDEVAKSAGESTRDVEKLGTAFGEMIAQNLNPAGLVVLAGVAAVIVATIAAAGAAVFAAMNLAAGAVSVLAGMLLSLASAAAFALAGGLLPLIPAALALAPALFVVVAGITELGKAGQKSFDKTHKGLLQAKKDFVALKDVAAKDFVRVLDQVAPTLLKLFAPMIKGAADAMVFIGKDFAKIMNTPGMKAFLAVFQRTMPGILTTLGLAFNRVFTGLVAFFRPVLPYAQRLADAILLIATRFSSWAESKPGQNAIADFMSKAWDAASSLWNIIVNLATAIGTLFGAGQQNGQGFLDWLDKLTARFATWLSSATGQADLKQWFTDAAGAAQALWGVISALAQVFDSLDTSTSRQAVIQLLTVLQQVVQVFGAIVAAAAGMAMPILTVMRVIMNIVFTVFGSIAKVMVDTFGWLPMGIGENLRKGYASFLAFAGQANGAIDSIQKTIPLTVEAGQALTTIDLVNTALGLLPRSKTVTINTYYQTHGSPPSASGKGGNVAAGDIAYGPQRRLIGEAGPEAVVPLARPLALVDPSVRALSAVAQGKAMPMASGGVSGGGKTVNVAQGAIVVNTTQANPQGVALSVLDRFTAAAV